MEKLSAAGVTLSYRGMEVVKDLSLSINEGEITTIVGPNGCGKSTLLRALARLLKPDSGAVILDGELIHRLPAREAAKRLGLLAQRSGTAVDVTVEDLVRRGRYPHQSFLQPPNRRDAEAVDHALDLAGMQDLRLRSVDELSGGQRQRAWMAMALAQETPVLLLDEPTTYLDLAHQMEITDLIQRVNREEGRTIVMVLHDLNEASRISHRIVAMKAGRIVADGPAATTIDAHLVNRLYNIRCDVCSRPGERCPFLMPRGVPDQAHASLPSTTAGFCAAALRFGYHDAPVLNDIDLTIPSGAITAIIGPNGCGKSTFLRTCARLLAPDQGSVTLGGEDVRGDSHRAFARRVALLGQEPPLPNGVLVEDLVAMGRRPHQGFLRQWRVADEAAVEEALSRLEIADLRFRPIDELSGGQRQRVWMAMALAQKTPVLLLDEPTTFLDISAQIAFLDLIRSLNRVEGRTIVMIMHDLNLAARYADHLVAMKDGAIAAAGAPRDVLTEGLVRTVFGIEADIDFDGDVPLVRPRIAGSRPAALPSPFAFARTA